MQKSQSCCATFSFAVKTTAGGKLSLCLFDDTVVCCCQQCVFTVVWASVGVRPDSYFARKQNLLHDIPKSLLQLYVHCPDTSPCFHECRWRAYFTSGSSAAYLFLYSMFYFWTKLDITRYVPMAMYFGYMAIVSYSFFCMTGTIGFFACWLFVRQIYAAVKID